MMELSWMFILTTIFISLHSSHPLLWCLALVTLTLAMSPFISLILSKWIAYAIILIFLGGMMVLFIYVSTLVGNEKLIFPFVSALWLIPAFISVASLPSVDCNTSLITHLYSGLSVSLLLFLTLYLLFTLFIVIFLSQGFKGALMKYS